jgi:hypothetical protein
LSRHRWCGIQPTAARIMERRWLIVSVRSSRWTLAVSGVAVAAVIGALGGAFLAWSSAAFAAVSCFLVVLLATWLRTQFNDLRRRLGEERAQQARTAQGQREQFAQTLRRMSQLEKELAEAEKRLIGKLDRANDLKGVVEGHSQIVRRAADGHFRQLEALQNLHKILDVRGPLPPSRGWAISPDLLLVYVGQILARRPSLVVECGSGLSTLWAAYALERCGTEGRVVALEHDVHYAQQTRDLLSRHGLADRAEVRHAAIGQVDVGGEPRPWYDLTAVKDLDGVDVLLVDGPIGTLAPLARYPALPLLRERLSAGAVVLLDDALREDEQAIVERWVSEWPELHLQELPHEKGSLQIDIPG